MLYKRVKANEIRNKLSNELMMYHMQIDPANVHRCINSIIPQPSEVAPDFDKFTFMPRSVAYESTPMVRVNRAFAFTIYRTFLENWPFDFVGCIVHVRRHGFHSEVQN